MESGSWRCFEPVVPNLRVCVLLRTNDEKDATFNELVPPRTDSARLRLASAVLTSRRLSLLS